MTTRIAANLVLGCALSAVAAGCTVHTYSARPEYPSTVFVSREPSRHEASFQAERSRDRATYRSVGYRPARHREISRNDTKPESHARPVSDPKPETHASTKPSRNESTAEKPSTGKKNEEHVDLMPAKPTKTEPAKTEPAKTEPAKKRTRILSFRERLEAYVDKTNAEVAQKERERRKRMSSVIGAAADKHN